MIHNSKFSAEGGSASGRKIQEGKGYTLIELLIYTAVFAIAVGVFSGVLITFTRVQTQTSVDSELTQQLSFVQSIIQRLVRESVNIQNPAGVASSSLVLRMASTTLDPTIISSDANSIYLKQGTGSVIPLTNSQVKISQFQVAKYENPGAHAIVQVDISLIYNSQNPYQQITRSLKTAIGRVSAATFDDTLVPNADNAYSLGIASTNRWKDINISNLLNLGQLIADPVAGVQNGSIYYNSSSSVFRGYKAGSWQNLGEGFWTASGNNISNTNSGNVGIGTSTPSSLLDVAGTVQLRGFSTSTTGLYVNGSGNVGIGTTGPGAKLNVIGDIIADLGSDTTRIVGISGFATGKTGIFRFADQYNQFETTFNGTLKIKSYHGLQVYRGPSFVEVARFGISSGSSDSYFNGNVGIGTSTPSEKLDVVGNIKLKGVSDKTVTLEAGGATGDWFDVKLLGGSRIWRFQNDGGIYFWDGSAWITKVAP